MTQLFAISSKLAPSLLLLAALLLAACGKYGPPVRPEVSAVAEAPEAGAPEAAQEPAEETALPPEEDFDESEAPEEGDAP